MTLQPSKLDSRDFEDILASLRQYAQLHIPEWEPGDESDAGVMLQHTFARLMEIFIERLNRAPEKHLLAFLDTMNISPLPPVPAAAPLIFSLKKNTPPLVVPRGAAITAKQPGGTPAVFETTDDITVLPSEISCAYVIEPDRNRYADYTGRLAGIEGDPLDSCGLFSGFTPFTGGRIKPDAWYFIENRALAIEKPASIILILNFSSNTTGTQIKRFIDYRRWSYSTEDGDADFTPNYIVDTSKTNYRTIEINLSPDGTPPTQPGAADCLGGGREPEENGIPLGGRYITCALRDDASSREMLVKLPISSARIKVEGAARPPEHLFSQNSRIEPEGYFEPFGKQPKEGYAFYVDMGDLLSLPGATIKLTLELSHTNISAGKVGNNTRWCDLHWFYYSGDGWKRLSNVKSDSPLLHDIPNGVTMTLAFPCPADAIQHKYGGEEGCWLRAVLPDNDCGKDAEWEFIPASNSYKLKDGTGTFVYPLARSISLGFEYTTNCQCKHRLWHIYSGPNQAEPDGAVFPELNKSAFYLGFDRFYPQQPVSLYAAAASSSAWDGLSGNRATLWEYLVNDGGHHIWHKLYVNDATNGFTRSGAIRFLTPSNAAKEQVFDNTERYWIRISQVGNPRLEGLYLNAVPADNAITVSREKMGTSNGSADQRFVLRGTPVLSGQRLWICEAEAPTAGELPDTSLDIRQNPVTLEQEYWVLWNEQNSFGASLPNSRHYTLDRVTGEICFGDGIQGIIPDKGSAIAMEYRYGGGTGGNLPAGAVTKFPSSLAGIDKVYNPIPATGGSDSEPAVAIRDRGPMALRHRMRGVTARDIEWLVKEASGAAVDRVKCLTGDTVQTFSLLLLPAADGSRPLPDGILSASVRHYLDQHLPVQMVVNGYGIVGPRYITIRIDAALVPQNPLESIPVRERALERLQTYLHPRLGGSDGQGWEFGRNVYLSEICAVLEGIEGVGHTMTDQVSIQPFIAQRELTLRSSDARLGTVYPAGSLISLANNTNFTNHPYIYEQWMLAEPIVTEVLPKNIRVTGFREGDELGLAATFYYSQGWLIPISPRLLEFPAGSIVRMEDGFITRLVKALPPTEQLNSTNLKTYLEKSPLKDFAEMAKITIIHPDTLTVTAVRDVVNGYELTVRRPPDEAVLHYECDLHCLQSKVQVKVHSFADQYSILNENEAVLFFRNIHLPVGLAKSAIQALPANLTYNMPARLTLPDSSEVVDITITFAKTIADVAYLSERELTTPGAINILISEQL